MADIRPYLKISEISKAVKDLYVTAEKFAEVYRKAPILEKKALLQHFIINNKPFGFNEAPILFERLKEYLSEILEIDCSNIRLIGSAKTGFSISEDHYGRKFIFDGTRDLDFTVISHDVFLTLTEEFEKWVDLFQREKLTPPQSKHSLWVNNIASGRNQIRHKFFDLKYIPNLTDDFPFKTSISEALFQIQFKLNEYHGLKVKFASIRVYKTWSSFLKMLEFNTNSIMKNR